MKSIVEENTQIARIRIKNLEWIFLKMF